MFLFIHPRCTLAVARADPQLLRQILPIAPAVTPITAARTPAAAGVTGTEARLLGTPVDTGVMEQRYQMKAGQMALYMFEAIAKMIGRTGTT